MWPFFVFVVNNQTKSGLWFCPVVDAGILSADFLGEGRPCSARHMIWSRPAGLFNLRGSACESRI